MKAMTRPFDDHEERAAASLNPGRRVRIAEPLDPEVPYEVYDADTGRLVLELATREQVDAFIGRYGCTDVDEGFRGGR